MARENTCAHASERRARPRHRAASLAALLAAVGCGASGQPAASTPRPAASASASASAPFVAAPSPLRRLTNEEYNNAVRDLLGDSSRPADSFPPDEVVGGFENNTISPITQPLVERYMNAAEALAAAAAPRLDRLAPCPAGAPPEPCGRAFIESFGRLAFRRPLEADERDGLLALYNHKLKRSSHKQAVQLVIEAVLQSPRFLYRVEPAAERGSAARPLDGYEMATRLSFFLWASTPDAQLLDEAAAGKLKTAQDVERTARRMLKDERANEGIRSFHRQWFDLREIETASRDQGLFPGFTPELRKAMVEESLRFGAHAVQSGGDAVATLFTSKKSYINGPLGKLYGVKTPGEGFTLVDLPAGERSGFLTHASLMTVHANAEQTSPILRGKFVRERLLCQPVPPPPPNVPPAPKFDPKLTKKELFARHQADPSCGGCHKMMDPIGFGFERYDAIGAYRTVEGPHPVDSTGKLTGTDDADGAFTDALTLGEQLARSQQVRRCVATQWFRAALGRVERSEDDASLDQAYLAFSRAGYDVRELLVAIATSDPFRHAGADEEGSP